MPGDHLLRGGFEFGGLMFEVGAGATAGLGGIAGELHAIDGEHLATEQALAVTDGEDGAEDLGDVVA
jgi:hypothetical protein